MKNIPWDNPASLYRVIHVTTVGSGREELVARGTLHELVGQFVEMSPEQQRDLLIRTVERDRTWAFDEAQIRELAARPEFAGVE